MFKHKPINFIHFSSIHSTNSWAKENSALLDSEKITCITADEQTAGRGTFAKKWHSPRHVNIYLTLHFACPKDNPYLANMGQILAISCCRHLHAMGFAPQIKWPNDLFLEDKKFSGILCEMISSKTHSIIILGIGLNVNMTEEATCQIDQPATSLMQVSGKMYEIENILHPILSYFVDDLDLLLEKGFSPFAAQYNNLLRHKGSSLQVRDGSHMREGICQGVSPKGALLLTQPSGEEIPVFSGRIIHH